MGVSVMYENESLHLNGVTIGNDNTIATCGGKRYDSGYLLVSRDNGNSFQQQHIIDKTLYDVQFFQDKTYIVGYDGKLFYSVDTFSTKNFYQGWIWFPLRSVGVWNNGETIVVGGHGYQHGVVYRSYDNLQGYTADTIQNELRDVAIIGESTAVAVGYGLVQYTDDRGNSWQYADIEGDFFTAVCFPNSIVGYAVGYQGTIIKSIDRGKTWKKLRNGNNLAQRKWNLNDVFFINDLQGYAVGDKGLIVKTNDGGKNWDYVECPSKNDLHSICIKNNMGIIVGENGIILKFVL